MAELKLNFWHRVNTVNKRRLMRLTLRMGHASNLGARALVVNSPVHAEQ